MQINNDDILLADKIAKGDSDAENTLFKRYEERIHFLVRVRLRGRINSEIHRDIVSEAYNAVLVSLRKGGFDPSKGKPVEAYIAGIVSNVVALHFRNLKKEKQTDDIDLHQHISNGENQLSDILEEEKKEKIQLCLSRIKDKYKEVLILRIYDDKSIEEISDHLGIEKRRVSERINYAFKLLLTELKKENYFQYPSQKSK
ncbi:MAG: sigma-70 family RNA polymerase sigma factor [Ignavibacteriales bacterium]|nr:MAG: sigma-70 family RNA polymerase sigma factor [Ignavibacteriales bacterium]